MLLVELFNAERAVAKAGRMGKRLCRLRARAEPCEGVASERKSPVQLLPGTARNIVIRSVACIIHHDLCDREGSYDVPDGQTERGRPGLNFELLEHSTAPIHRVIVRATPS